MKALISFGAAKNTEARSPCRHFGASADAGHGDRGCERQ